MHPRAADAPAPAMVRVGTEATETPGLVQRIAAIEPDEAVPPASASETLACVMPVLMFGSVGFGTMRTSGMLV